MLRKTWGGAHMGVRWWLPALALAAVVAIGAACDDDDEPTDPGVTDDEIHAMTVENPLRFLSFVP